jgi:hypothetical protein
MGGNESLPIIEDTPQMDTHPTMSSMAASDLDVLEMLASHHLPPPTSSRSTSLLDAGLSPTLLRKHLEGIAGRAHLAENAFYALLEAQRESDAAKHSTISMALNSLTEVCRPVIKIFLGSLSLPHRR